MMAAKTTNPMASPAQPAGARRSITPNTVNTRRKVPMNSAKVAWLYPTPGWKAATPSPSVFPATLPSTPMMARLPRIAPTTCAPMYAGTFRHGNFLVAASATVTAGLMWHPEMWPMA